MAFEAANLVMLYLLGVVIIALVYGRWPSVLATVINVISFDLFFVAPRRDAGGVGCPVSAHLRRDAHRGPAYRQLTAGVRYQARVARYRERRTRHLYEMSQSAGGGSQPAGYRHHQRAIYRLHLSGPQPAAAPGRPGKLLPLTHQPGLTPWDDAIARWSFDKGPTCRRRHRYPARRAVSDLAPEERRPHLGTTGGGTGESAPIDDPGAAAAAGDLYSAGGQRPGAPHH